MPSREVEGCLFVDLLVTVGLNFSQLIKKVVTNIGYIDI